MSTYPTYNIGIGAVTTANPYTHVYRINDYLQIQDNSRTLTAMDAIPLGSRGDSASGVQFQTSYKPGDIVLYVRETGGESTTSLAFIIGLVTTSMDSDSYEESGVAATTWDGANLNNTNFTIFDQIEQAAGAKRVSSNLGHTGIDMLPGAYEIVGKLLSFQFSDYYAALRATCAEILINGIDRRIVLQSMLRTESTVNSLSDIGILNQSIIDTRKWCGNVKAAWYDCLQEDDESITPIEDKQPKYRIIEQSGDILYGSHKTLFDQTATTPLYTEYLGLDGTKKLLTASRLVVGKYPGVTCTEYVGDRLAVEKHEGEDPTPDLIGDPLSELNTDDKKNWVRYVNTEFVENGGYPENFLEPTEGEYPDFKEIELADDLRRDKKIKISPGNSFIDFQDDGSIKITDAWGSFILLSHGNIELHAVNNLFAVSGRDTLCFAGGNRTDFAKQSVAVQAFKGSFKVASKKSLQICSESDLTVEARKTLYIIAQDSELDSLNVTVRCINPAEPDSGMPGNFQVFTKNGSIDFISRQFRSNALYISLTSDKLDQAFVLGGSNPLLVGTLDIRGGIWSKGESIKLTLPRGENEEALANKVFTAPDVTNWINRNGNMTLSAGRLAARHGVYSAGPVCGSLVCDTRIARKKYVGNVNGSMLDTVCLSGNSANRVVSKDITINTDSAIEEYSFTFETEEANTTSYRLVNPLPERGASTEKYTGFEDISGDVSYIYPGENFWNSDGVLDYTDTERVEYSGPITYGFAEIPTAKTK